jgi:carbonic anhydrase
MTEELIQELIDGNKEYVSNMGNEIVKHVSGQKPKIAILTCADSRVIPEFIFNKSIGELFVVRVAGNIALGETVIKSLEYAVDHLNVKILIILGHTNCGAIKAAEDSEKLGYGELMEEIRSSFSMGENHTLCNLSRQLSMLPKRSEIINKHIKEETVKLIGAIYNLETGFVEFL